MTAFACRPGCAACCEAPSISSPLPGMPDGKPPGTVCPALDPATRRCTVWGTERYPPVCRAFSATAELCGTTREEALERLAELERATAPAPRAGRRSAVVTGFEPFAGGTVNPSWQAVAALPDRVGPFDLRKVLLPVSFRDAFPLLERAVEAARPDLVICTGLAASRGGIALERVALNVNDAEIPDNAGDRPVDRPIDPSAPDACFSTLPLRRILARLRKEPLPAAISNSAGTFVCNDVMFRLLRLAALRHPGTAAGFIHVPATPDMPDMPGRTESAPGMELSAIVRGLELAIEACADRQGSSRGVRNQ